MPKLHRQFGVFQLTGKRSNGDRFYGSPALIAWCRDRGWDWRLRLKKDLLVFAEAFDLGIGVDAEERAQRETAELYAKIGQLTVERDFLSKRSGR